MKKILATAVVAALGAMIPASQAATTSNNFNVSVTLSSQCAATNSGTTTVAFGTYTAFQGAALASSSVNLAFQCTRGFAPVSIAFDVVNGTAAGVGILQGLQYTLTAAAPVTVAVVAAVPATVTGAAAVSVYCRPCRMPTPAAVPLTTSNATEVGAKPRVHWNVRLTGVPAWAPAWKAV